MRFHEDGPVRRSGRLLGRALHLPFTATGRGIRRATHAHGAGESGLGKLIELHAVNSAGDMLITVALASTVFFSVPTDEARGRVALYLAITLAPFAVLAPVVGPLLDRIPHGRRAAMAGAMLTRALLALTMAGAVAYGDLELYPAALGVLVASKAYGVVRSAVVPRLLPPRFSLVKANSRVTLAGLLATGAAAPLGAGLHQLGPGWPLYGAFVVFMGGAFLSFTLPHKVDSAKGEAKARLTSGEHHFGHRTAGHRPPVHRAPWHRAAGPTTVPTTAPEVVTVADPKPTPPPPAAPNPDPGGGRFGRWFAGGLGGGSGMGDGRKPGLRTVGPSVLHALQACASLKSLSGFLTLYLAFLLREHPVGGLSPEFSLGLVVVAAGGGNALGTAIGAWLRARGPERIIAVVLTSALGVIIFSAVLYSAVTVAAVAATAGISLALGKLSLDALIQRDVPEEVRTSAFSRSETTLQIAWVVGGAVGISLPLSGVVGMAAAATMIALGVALSVRGLLSAARHTTARPRVA
ncbi:MFS transporter [Streptomyces sp. Rer75]|uniref:MFS transporter n=1 Tax=Streptomyces sp. Rer75 TaxID=2750011 RepID=UPI0015CFD92A|nr:MFS transporter [Streptomyces sp. Rer75]QLH27071.1 MFS transporter [Streptomyces sp. Rer75]